MTATRTLALTTRRRALRVRTAAVAGVLAGAFAAAGCSDSHVACPAHVVASPVLLYPIPGATNVPDAPGFLVLAGLVEHGSAVRLTTSSGTPVAPTGPFGPLPSPLPSPIASAPPEGAGAFPLPALAAATTYTVAYAPAAGGSCGPDQPGGSLGTFTTR